MNGIRSSTTYGIDAGAGFTAVVRASGSARSVSFARVYEGMGDPADEHLVEAAAEIALASSSRRAAVAAALPAGETLVRRISTPLTSVPRARKVLPSLLDVRIPFRLEACAFAFPEIRRDAQGRVAALAVAAPSEAVARRLEDLRSRGFDPMTLDVEALAIWSRALAEHPPTPGARRVVAYAGADRFILAAGDGAAFSAAYSVRDAMRNPESGGAADPWAAALQRGRQAVAGTDGAQPGEAEWIWTGPGVERTAADLQAYETAIGAGLRIRWIRTTEPSLFLARALASRAASAIRGSGCNLRSGPLAHAKLTAWRETSERRAAGACIAAGLLLAAVSVTTVRRMELDAEALRTRVETEARRIGRLARVQRGQEVRMAREAVEKRLAASEPVARLFQPSAPSMLAGLLRVASPSSIAYDVVDIADTAVQAQGSAPDRDVIARVEDFLRLQGYRTQVKRGEPDSDGRVAFSVTGTKP